jgi:transcriptional regulator with XRE-family HTH domain
MSETIRDLISQLIAAARQRGLTQGELAERAGMTAVGLSKAKHRGDIRASTLAALATQLDLQLALVPRRSPAKAVEAIRSGTFFRAAPPAAPDGEH